ncbi:sigma-70 family RNA polymerase sigma factor [Vagococcus entomophilus]|uniref:RNA polymerase sigma factor SigS n=1 Tax=Vagococcus entomophilus TaxID=1160095 RepID=A0A430AFV5_9ENTE|nr:sigma-70 family RNA polymerase sigma factor [Vagococcus entomophilus]RSU06608.1 hypothetical protein CBF30_10205 [Vagococcus entomophilus]
MDERRLEQAIKEVKAGNNQLFPLIFFKYRPIILKTAKRYFLYDFDIEDWLQEGRIICYQSLKKYDATKKVTFGAFFKVNFERHIFSLLRKQNAYKRKLSYQAVSLEETVENLGDGIYSRELLQTTPPTQQLELREHLQGFFQQLSQFEQGVFTEYTSGMGIEWIAQKKKCSIKKVKNALDRIKRKLKEHIS